ncbi:MAG: ISAzo13 family transposase, partial [Spirochaetaceae bacterium]|nr:ISAzo13 family transposase [Spirochaetaceae bacterium]
NLIANTRTGNGLNIRAELDSGDYPTGKKISDEELERIKLRQSSFHGDWNYSIFPNS